jgi:hypothetical protein
VAKVEYVVYAPRNPVARNGRRYRSDGLFAPGDTPEPPGRASSTANRAPRAKLPDTLIQNVPHGRVPGVTVTASEIP